MDKIFADSDRFVDELGRERIFFGVNYGSKNIPGLGCSDAKQINMLEKNLSFLQSSGINVIRCFVNWSYLQPQPDKYNEKMLEEIQCFMDLCAKHSIYVCIDMHQDLYSAFIKSDNPNDYLLRGDSAPIWACMTEGNKYHLPHFVWAEGYFFNKAVQKSFDNFWNNTEVYGKGLQDHYADMWRVLASRFGDHPALFGFDIFNEPYPGSDGKKIFFAIAKSALKAAAADKSVNRKSILKSLAKKDLSGVFEQIKSSLIRRVIAPAAKYIEKFDREKYSPFINKISSAIRGCTSNGIILFENDYYSNLGIPFYAPPIETNGKREKNQAFSPHAYDIGVDTALYKYASNDRVGSVFRQRRAEQTGILHTPVIVGEWGGFNPWQANTDHADYLMDIFDKYKWSSIYWLFQPEMKNTPLMSVLRRPRPVAVCGRIHDYRFSRIDSVFSLSYDQQNECPAPTLIYCPTAPKRIKANGSVSAKQICGDGYIISIYTKPGKNEINIRI